MYHLTRTFSLHHMPQLSSCKAQVSVYKSYHILSGVLKAGIEVRTMIDNLTVKCLKWQKFLLMNLLSRYNMFLKTITDQCFEI